MTYWKATRPDGRDFHTGEVDYAASLSGQPLPVLPGTGEFPGPGWYHLATVPTDCVGMSWPCRLFEVEPADDLGDERPRHRNKVGAASVRVLREVPAHMALGPQGEYVAALIDRARKIDQGDISRLVAARVAAWAAAWDAARDAAWAAAWDAAWDAAWFAAWDAATALIVRDLIGQHHGWDQSAYDLLTGPWRQTIGPIHPDDPALEGDTDE